MKIAILPVDDPAWAEAAALISGEFARSFGAVIVAPRVPLAVARAADGRFLGAAGLRTAADGFFCECYLDGPVAEALAAASGYAVRPEDVIEVISMACPAPMSTLALVEAIIAEGRRQGMCWGLFTATSALARLLVRTGAPLLRLAPALPSRVERAGDWGSYYATDPWVCALPDIASPLQVLPQAAVLRARRRVADLGGEIAACA